jgi:hypothetical protein
VRVKWRTSTQLKPAYFDEFASLAVLDKLFFTIATRVQGER